MPRFWNFRVGDSNSKVKSTSMANSNLFICMKIFQHVQWRIKLKTWNAHCIDPWMAMYLSKVNAKFKYLHETDERFAFLAQTLGTCLAFDSNLFSPEHWLVKEICKPDSASGAMVCLHWEETMLLACYGNMRISQIRGRNNYWSLRMNKGGTPIKCQDDMI